MQTGNHIITVECTGTQSWLYRTQCEKSCVIPGRGKELESMEFCVRDCLVLVVLKYAENLSIS